MALSVLFRADANASIATGHIMRCFAMAQAVQDRGGKATFACTEIPAALKTRVTESGIEVRILKADAYSTKDAEETARIAKDIGAEWVMIDGYLFTDAYEAALKKHGLKILVVDDYGHASHANADLILNQNAGAETMKYDGEALLGSRYALLRRDVKAWAGFKRVIPEKAQSVLVMMGGADPPNATPAILEALLKTDLPKITVIAGAGNQNKDEIEAIASTDRRVDVQTDVSDMPSLLSKTDLAVTASGSATWECALLGLPMILVILAENQEIVSKGVSASGAGIALGWYNQLDADRLQKTVNDLTSDSAKRIEMMQAGQQLIDGAGTERVLMRMTKSRLRLREATEDDREMLWHWANDPAVRASAFETETIPWEEHTAWFDMKMESPKTKIFIAMDDQDEPVGQIRFDEEGPNEMIIDVHLAPTKRGQGYGTELIKAGVEKMNGVSVLTAHIRKDNDASVKAFTKAGFVQTAEGERKGTAMVTYKLSSRA